MTLKDALLDALTGVGIMSWGARDRNSEECYRSGSILDGVYTMAVCASQTLGAMAVVSGIEYLAGS